MTEAKRAALPGAVPKQTADPGDLHRGAAAGAGPTGKTGLEQYQENEMMLPQLQRILETTRRAFEIGPHAAQRPEQQDAQLIATPVARRQGRMASRYLAGTGSATYARGRTSPSRWPWPGA